MYYGKLNSVHSPLLSAAPKDKVFGLSRVGCGSEGSSPTVALLSVASVLWAMIPMPHPNCNLVCLSSLSPQQTYLLLCDQDWKGGLRF